MYLHISIGVARVLRGRMRGAQETQKWVYSLACLRVCSYACGGPARKKTTLGSRRRLPPPQAPIGLYRILPLPILYGIYCNKEGSGVNNALRNRVGDKGGTWGAYTARLLA